jgi:hypothetical protein
MLTKHCASDKIENEMGGACSAYGGGARERDHWGDPSAKGRVSIKMDIPEVGFGGMDWIDVAQDRDRWRALVNAAMNLRVA